MIKNTYLYPESTSILNTFKHVNKTKCKSELYQTDFQNALTHGEKIAVGIQKW
jgi:hypothetical protein